MREEEVREVVKERCEVEERNGGVTARERKGAMWGLQLKRAAYGKGGREAERGGEHGGGKQEERRNLLSKDDILFLPSSLKTPLCTCRRYNPMKS